MRPSDVRATDGDYETKIQVTWSDVYGANVYKVWRRDTLLGPMEHRANVATGPYNDHHAVFGPTYYYCVEACKDTECSSCSETDNGWLAKVAPPPPTNVQATDETYEGKVGITWTAPSHERASSYFVYRAGTYDGPKTQMNLFGVPETYYDDTWNLSPGETYYYWVKSKNQYGWSEFSDHDTGAPKLTPPYKVLNVQATDGTYDDHIQVTWNEMSRTDFYKVYRALGIDGTKSLRASPVGTQLNDGLVQAGGTYFYWLQGCNDAGCGQYSDPDGGYLAEPTPTSTPPTPSPEPSATLTPRPTVDRDPTNTPRPTATREGRPTPTSTGKPIATATNTPKITSTRDPRVTPSLTLRPSITATSDPRTTPTHTPIQKRTATPTQTVWPSVTASLDPRVTATLTARPSLTATRDTLATPTRSLRPSPTGGGWYVMVPLLLKD